MDVEYENVVAGLMRRPLPSFEQWLEKNGDGSRGGGFDAFKDLAERTHNSGPVGKLTADETAFLRLWMGMQIAVVELCNIEHQKGREPGEIMMTLPRVLGAAAVYGFASVAKDDVLMRQIAKILIEEFRFAAKEAADQIEARA